MSPPKSLFSPQAAQASDENAPIRTTKYVIPSDAVRLTPDGKLDEKRLQEVISHIEPFAKGRKLRRSEFRALVEKALKLSVSQLVISRVTGASVTYVRRVDAEIKSRCQNKKISEEIRRQAAPLRGPSNRYPKAFRQLTAECIKNSELNVIELSHALGVNPEYVRKVKREMQGLQKPKCVSPPPEIDEEDPTLLPERRLMNCASSFNVEQCGGRHEITCFDSRGAQIGRMIVELHRASHPSPSYVIVIDQNGRKSSYFNGGERLEFLQKLTGQKL